MVQRILVIKTSSMGDILHALPALTDAYKNFPNAQFDWLVDASFSDIVHLHPAINKVYSVGIRKWRHQNPVTTLKEIYKWRKELPDVPYDLILDCQGLWKSAIIGQSIKGTLAGFNKSSAREKAATLLYDRKIYADRDRHAVHQLRDLFAKTLGYAHPQGTADYGIRSNVVKLAASTQLPANSILCFHGTTWPNKHFPEDSWRDIVDLLVKNNFTPVLPYGNEEERKRAQRLATSKKCIILHKMPLKQLARTLCDCQGAIGLDTGLSHLAAALEVPSVALFGPTNPSLSGPIGDNQTILKVQFDCAPCGKRRCQIDPVAEYAPCWNSIGTNSIIETLKSITHTERACQTK